MTIDDKIATLSEFYDEILPRHAINSRLRDTTNTSNRCQDCEKEIPQERLQALQLNGTPFSCCRCIVCQKNEDAARSKKSIFRYVSTGEEAEDR